MWKHTGKTRPDFAVEPGPDQESVWDYPRPPALVTTDELVEVRVADLLIASTRSALRVLETASPPTYYIPKADIQWDTLVEVAQSSFCEWKGRASYFADASAPQIAIAWLYANPSQRFAQIDGHASFYPSRAACFVNGEGVRPQPGEFYGGWITDRVVGPFKGEPGTGHW
ncbi:MAG: DUF427 domain-containing protein [Congregibacter sp.]